MIQPIADMKMTDTLYTGGKKAASIMSMPAKTKSFELTLCVSFQTLSLLSVQGVLIPKKKLGLTI
ncbi:hypothetical protein B4140_3517 [Bacillus amyloliquefaciens]|nr:hypothetical protein B4140_3517 [Bacillus amyloliquefaciens]